MPPLNHADLRAPTMDSRDGPRVAVDPGRGRKTLQHDETRSGGWVLEVDRYRGPVGQRSPPRCLVGRIGASATKAPAPKTFLEVEGGLQFEASWWRDVELRIAELALGDDVTIVPQVAAHDAHHPI